MKQVNTGEERGRWMVIRRTSGKVVELSTVFVSRNTKPRRNKTKGTTSAQKQDENERDCVKRLARSINCNFTHGDLLLTAKYDEEGMTRLIKAAEARRRPGQSEEDALFDALDREAENYVRRLGRQLAKEGIELRYIIVPSDMDGETGELVRPHVHIILPRVSFDAAALAWKGGSVEYQILKDQDDYTPLALYLCRQARRRPGKQKYRCSRNLKKPIVNERWAKPGEELRPDRNGKVVARNEWETGKPQYIRFIKGEALPAGRGQRRKQEEAAERIASGPVAACPDTGEIRCPQCGQLMAVRHENGMIECKARKQTLWAARAILCCHKCGREVAVE